MHGVLSSAELYEFTGGAAPSREQLRARYRAQIVGPGSGEVWHNWVVRLGDVAVGFVQATVTGEFAQLAWLVGVEWQGRGIASEAAAAASAWLSASGMTRLTAHIHLAHTASQRVACAIGLRPTHLGPRRRGDLVVRRAVEGRCDVQPLLIRAWPRSHVASKRRQPHRCARPLSRRPQKPQPIRSATTVVLRQHAVARVHFNRREHFNGAPEPRPCHPPPRLGERRFHLQRSVAASQRDRRITVVVPPRLLAVLHDLHVWTCQPRSSTPHQPQRRRSRRGMVAIVVSCRRPMATRCQDHARRRQVGGARRAAATGLRGRGTRRAGCQY